MKPEKCAGCSQEIVLDADGQLRNCAVSQRGRFIVGGRHRCAGSQRKTGTSSGTSADWRAKVAAEGGYRSTWRDGFRQ